MYALVHQSWGCNLNPCFLALYKAEMCFVCVSSCRRLSLAASELVQTQIHIIFPHCVLSKTYLSFDGSRFQAFCIQLFFSCGSFVLNIFALNREKNILIDKSIFKAFYNPPPHCCSAVATLSSVCTATGDTNMCNSAINNLLSSLTFTITEFKANLSLFHSDKLGRGFQNRLLPLLVADDCSGKHGMGRFKIIFNSPFQS